MNTLAHNAAEVWAGMSAGRLRPSLALDLFAPYTTDRRAALDAILMAALIATAEARPTAREPSAGSLPDIVAGGIAGHLLREEYDQAATTLADLKAWIHHVDATAHPYPLAAPWIDWCAEMGRAIAICRALSAEARTPGASQ